MQRHWSKALRATRIRSRFCVARSDKQSATDPPLVAHPPMSDESACRAVCDQHGASFPAAQYRFIKNTNPILAPRSRPILLDYAAVFRFIPWCRQPEALPVRRTGVVDTSQTRAGLGPSPLRLSITMRQTPARRMYPPAHACSQCCKRLTNRAGAPKAGYSVKWKHEGFPRGPDKC